MSCQVTYNADNTVKEAKAPNGEPSSVYSEIKNIIGKANIPFTENEKLLAQQMGVPVTIEGQSLLHWATTYNDASDQTKEIFGTKQGEIAHPYQVVYGSYNSNGGVIGSVSKGGNSFASLTPKDSYTAEELLTHVLNNSENNFNKFLAQLLLQHIPKDFPIKVRKYDRATGKTVTLGTYKYTIDKQTSTLTNENINLNIYKDGNSGFNEQTFLHEAVHAATVFILNSKYSSLTPEQQEAKNQLEKLYQLSKQVLLAKNSKQYGLTNLKEFVAELFTNPEFAEELGKIKLNKKVSIRTKIAQWILGLVGFKQSDTSDNLYYAAMDNCITLMSGNDYIRQSKLQDVEKAEDTSEFSLSSAQQNLINKSNTIQVGINPTTGKEEDFYIDTVTGEKRKRVTDPRNGLNAMIKGKVFNQTLAEFLADEYWKNDPPTTPLVTPTFRNEAPKTKDEFIEAFNKSNEAQMLQGSIRELMIKLDTTQDPRDQQKMDDLIQRLKDLTGNPNISFEWMRKKETRQRADGSSYTIDNMATIHMLIGSNAKIPNVPVDHRDKLEFGITVQSKALGYAGTMDIGVMHPNGEITGIELKTGSAFLKDANHKALLKYGATLGLTATNLNMAKLQLTWYAVMARLNDPSIKFRNLKVLYANNENTLNQSDAVHDLTDLDSFFTIIQEFLRDPAFLKEMGLDQDMYYKLEEEFISNGGTNLRDLFNVSNYYNDSPYAKPYSSTVNVNNGALTDLEQLVQISKGIPDKITGQKLKDAQERAANFLNKFKALTSVMDANQENNPFAKEVRATLGGKLYQMNDWASDVMQALNIYKNQVAQQFEKEATNKTNIIAAFQRKILGNNLGLSTFESNKKRFEKFYTTEKIYDANKKVIREEVRLLHNTEAVGSEQQRKYNALTADEKALLDYANSRIEHWVGTNGVFSKPSINDIISGEQISEIELFNREQGNNFVYYKGWFPKVPVATETEYQENLGGPKSKQILESFKTKIGGLLTDIIKLEGRTKNESIGLPLRYMGNLAVLNDVEKKEIYTYDIFRALSSFETEMQSKFHFDPYYHLGRVVSEAFSTAQLTNQYGQRRFPNEQVGDWLKNHIQINVRKLTSGGAEFRNPIPISTKYGTRQIDTSDVILKMNSIAASGIMAFRVFSAVGNIAGPGIINLRTRLTNEVLRILNVDEKYLDTRLSSYLNVNKEVKNFLKAKFTNNLYQDKVFLLAQENNFMINFDAAKAISNTVQSSRFSASSVYNKFKYYLQNTSEEITAVNLMVAQLYNIKHNNRPLYDYYEVLEIDEDGNIADTAENRSKLQAKAADLGAANVQYRFSSKAGTGAYSATYIGGKRFTEKSGSGSNVTYTDVYGLSPQEINRMKVVYDRKHGEYRERFSMETNALASMFIMLKRYMPRVLKNLFESRKLTDALGAYEEIPGEDGVYEWKPQYISGRVRLLMSLVLPVLTKDKNGTTVNWNTMSVEEKKLTVDTLLSAAMWGALYGIYVLLFGDSDDDETMKKWFKRYAVDNANQEVNPLELLKETVGVTKPVPLEFVDRAANGFSELFLASVNIAVGNEEDAYTTRGDLKGLNNTMRSLSVTAWGWDTYQKIKNSEYYDPEKGNSE